MHKPGLARERRKGEALPLKKGTKVRHDNGREGRIVWVDRRDGQDFYRVLWATGSTVASSLPGKQLTAL